MSIRVSGTRTTRHETAHGLAFRVLSSHSAAADTRPPVVLVHGIGMSHRYLDRLQQALGTAGPVHAIDLPGFGGLPKPGHDVDVPAMGRALAEVIASLDSGPVILLGHSMGAQWVAEAALHRPDLVARLAIMGPVADNAHRTLAAQMSALILDTLREPPLANAIVFVDYIRCGIPWYLMQVRHMLSHPIEQRVPLLSMPLLVIRGGRDPIAGLAWCRALRDVAPNGALVEIPRRHHVAQHGAARAVASALSAFIEGRIGSQEAVR